ncbi:hydrogenase 4 subunit B [Acetobacteraceae bacterium H6797]|nr:hydrogenase 4 subunit B [Acetobacteraceae bacterium H6797]
MTATLALLILALMLAPLALLASRRGGIVVLGLCTITSAGFALGGLGLLLGGGEATASWLLPIGPVWSPLSLRLDALSAWFLLVLGLTGGASSLAAIAHGGAGRVRELMPFPYFLAGMALTLLADDGITLLLGFEGMSLASWLLVAADHEKEENRAAARRYLIFAGFSGLCLLAAMVLLAAGSGGTNFAALRARPPEGWQAVALLALVTLGAGSKAGLVPLHAWLPQAHPAAPSHVSALMSAGMTKIALYVLARMLLDLGGPAQPLWWSLPLIVLGAGSALIGALRANLETDTKVVLACSTIEHVGLIALSLGLAAAFRAADLGTLAALAAGAAMLHVLAHAVFKTLLFLGAGEVLHAAGTRRMDLLGGLIHPMPLTALAMLAAILAAAALPPLAGFPGEWMLLQSLLAAWRVGHLAFQILVAATAAVVALSVALGAAAMVRFFAVVFLGRPRSPRGMGASEAARLALGLMLTGAALCLALGLLPGPMLDLAEPALRLLTGAAPSPRNGPLVLAPGDGASRYAPIALGILMAGAFGFVLWQVRRRSPLPVSRGPVWDNGFIAPPPHLPLGDPLTQPSAEGMAQPLRRMLGEGLMKARETVTTSPPGSREPARLEAGFTDPSEPPLARLLTWRDWLADRAEALNGLSIRRYLSLAFGALVLLLAILAWMEGR